jgi:SAM-dependent methyltransferase
MSEIARCLCCGSDSFANDMTLREMMFGFRNTFGYHQCSDCGTVQIKQDIGSALGRYYPPNYYSFTYKKPAKRPLKDAISRARAEILVRNNALSRLVAYKSDDAFLRQMINLGVRAGDRILDVGCGNGWWLREFARRGFKVAHGVDPYIEKDITEDGFDVWKRELDDVKGQYDFVMFHHSLEHFADPLAALKRVKQILSPSGVCLVRVPTCSSDAFDIYGKDWVQLDAPRHYFIPSREGMKQLGERSGIPLKKTIDDSNGAAFWASEQYQNDIPLHDPKSVLNDRAGSMFTEEQLRAFEAKALSANSKSRGDQAAFVFRQ